MEPIAITDVDDPRVRDYVGLRDPDRRRVVESDEFFIAEGVNVIERLVASPYTMRSVLLTPLRFVRMEAVVRPLPCPVYVAERDVLAKVAGFDLHRGAVASADRGAPHPVAHVLEGARTIAALEGLNDAENLGVLARSARGLGIDALVLDPTCTDPFYRRTVRVSMGEVLLLPFARSSDWYGDLDVIERLGFRLLALTPSPTAISIYDIQRVPGDRVAVILGSEGPGLSAETLARCEQVRIPLRAGTDSLNVGHAGAIAFALLRA